MLAARLPASVRSLPVTPEQIAQARAVALDPTAGPQRRTIAWAILMGARGLRIDQLGLIRERRRIERARTRGEVV